MKMLDVYPVYDIQPERGEGCFIFDDKGHRYLDFYGGHAVISIGHSHPHYITRISAQLSDLGFYSNSIKIPIQEVYARKLGELSGYPDYGLFLCNSGAEAIENAIKIAAFNYPGKRIVALQGGFHGRTSMSVSCTDNDRIQTKFDQSGVVDRISINDMRALEQTMGDDVCAVIFEGIQGIAGIHVLQTEFLQRARILCDQFNACLILDEVQSGFGRSGRFFAHQGQGVQADVITMAKGMGNGFPVGGVLAKPGLDIWRGMLGSTFGGNHLACAAGLAVLEVIENEDLIHNAQQQGDYLIQQLLEMAGIKEVRGKGLMVGLECNEPVADLRKELLYDHHIFTGGSSNPNVLRLLPPLSIGQAEIDSLIQALQNVLSTKPHLVK